MNRRRLKFAGKEKFKKNYGRSVGACLVPFIPAVIIAVVLIILAAIGINLSDSSNYMNYNSYSYNYYSYKMLQYDTDYLRSLAIFAIVAFVICLLVFIFQVMINRFFLMNRKQISCKVFSTMFSFKGKEYLKILGAMFLISLWLIIPYIINWFSLYFKALYFEDVYSSSNLLFPLSNLLSILSNVLFVVGIIKFSYSYFMVPYILAENPNIGVKRAVKISKLAMKGAKWDLFVFYLSFIGWWLLTGLTLGILNICYTTPYFEASRAEFYWEMRQRAKRMKIFNAKELA